MILNLLLRVKLSRSFAAIIELNVVSWLHLTLIRLFQIYLWKKFSPSLYFVISCFCMLRKESFPKCMHWNENKISIVFLQKHALSYLGRRKTCNDRVYWRRSRVVAEVASTERVCEVNNKGKPHLIHIKTYTNFIFIKEV